MILDYIILEANDKDMLRTKIRQLMRDERHWIPLGGVSVVQEGTWIVYSQAMVHETP